MDAFDAILSAETLELNAGETAELTVIIVVKDNNVITGNQATWSSSNTKVVTAATPLKQHIEAA